MKRKRSNGSTGNSALEVTDQVLAVMVELTALVTLVGILDRYRVWFNDVVRDPDQPSFPKKDIITINRKWISRRDMTNVRDQSSYSPADFFADVAESAVPGRPAVSSLINRQLARLGRAKRSIVPEQVKSYLRWGKIVFGSIALVIVGVIVSIDLLDVDSRGSLIVRSYGVFSIVIGFYALATIFLAYVEYHYEKDSTTSQAGEDSSREALNNFRTSLEIIPRNGHCRTRVDFPPLVFYDPLSGADVVALFYVELAVQVVARPRNSEKEQQKARIREIMRLGISGSAPRHAHAGKAPDQFREWSQDPEGWNGRNIQLRMRSPELVPRFLNIHNSKLNRALLKSASDAAESIQALADAAELGEYSTTDLEMTHRQLEDLEQDLTGQRQTPSSSSDTPAPRAFKPLDSLASLSKPDLWVLFSEGNESKGSKVLTEAIKKKKKIISWALQSLEAPALPPSKPGPSTSSRSSSGSRRSQKSLPSQGEKAKSKLPPQELKTTLDSLKKTAIERLSYNNGQPLTVDDMIACLSQLKASTEAVAPSHVQVRSNRVSTQPPQDVGSDILSRLALKDEAEAREKVDKHPEVYVEPPHLTYNELAAELVVKIRCQNHPAFKPLAFSIPELDAPRFRSVLQDRNFPLFLKEARAIVDRQNRKLASTSDAQHWEQLLSGTGKGLPTTCGNQDNTLCCQAVKNCLTQRDLGLHPYSPDQNPSTPST